MKKAILILGDGTTVDLTGRFVLITETAGTKTLSCIDLYKNGKEHSVGFICDSLTEALDCIREQVKR